MYLTTIAGATKVIAAAVVLTVRTVGRRVGGGWEAGKEANGEQRATLV